MCSSDLSLLVVVPDWGRDAKLAVLDASTGIPVWECPVLRDMLFDTAVSSAGVFTLESFDRRQRLKGYSLAKGEPLFPDYLVNDGDLTEIAMAGEHIVLTGDRSLPRAAVLDRTGREVFSVRPAGAEYLAAAVVDGTLIVATDRGTFGYARADSYASEQMAARAAGSGDPCQLVRLAQAAAELDQSDAAQRILAQALRATTDDAGYLRIADRLSGLRDRIHERHTPILRCVRMDRPPTIDGILADDWDESACRASTDPNSSKQYCQAPHPTATSSQGPQHAAPADGEAPTTFQ